MVDLLDANILFSAAYRQDAGIGRLWHFHDIKLITSPYAAEEAQSTLRKGTNARDLKHCSKG